MYHRNGARLGPGSCAPGTSSTTSVLLGLFQIIDGNKFKILYIPFFKDKYTHFGGVGYITGPDERAYYKALEKAADADLILAKSMDREDWGIPLLFTTKSVTWRGKALQIRPDR